MRELIIEIVEIRQRRESGWFLGRCRSVADPAECRELDFPGELKVTGVWPDVEPGIPYRVHGEITNSGRWGRSLDLGGRRIIAERVPRLVSQEGAFRYLMSIKEKMDAARLRENLKPLRVGPGLLRKAISYAAADGGNVIAFIRENPDQISVLDRWTPEKAEGLAEELRNHVADERTLAELASLGAGGGFSANQIQAVFDEFRADGPELVRENPYRFIEQWDGDEHDGWSLEGFGWARADVIATRNIGMDLTSPARVMASLGEAARRVNRQGDTYGTVSETVWTVQEFAALPPPMVGRMIPHTKAIVREGDRIYSAPIHWAEVAIAGDLGSRMGEPRAPTPNPKDASILRDANDEQRNAYGMAMGGGINILTGGPGRGKTWICKAIIRGLRARGRRPCALAPTGRAAARFTELTQERASTIHRFLAARDDVSSSVSDFIVDESSMVDVHLMARLFRAIGPYRNILFVGDPDQLPPVGPGKPFLELIESGIAGCVKLERVMRTDRLGLIEAAAAVLESGETGIIPRLESIKCPSFEWKPAGGNDAVRGIVAAVLELLEEGVDADDIQAITARNGYSKSSSSVPLNTKSLNAELQRIMNPNGEETKAKASGELLRVGDRVMQLKNDTKMKRYGGRSSRDTIAVMNGEMGRVVTTLAGSGGGVSHVVVDFGGIGGGVPRVVKLSATRNNLVLAYCATCHKFQGSESPIVLLSVDASGAMLADRSWIYTGITRASQRLMLWCPRDVLHRACRGGMRVEKRRSSLGERLEKLRKTEPEPLGE